MLADPLAAGESAGDRLYRLLVVAPSPACPRTPASSSFPDGALHGLNFETLPVDGVQPHYWIEDAEIQIAPSLASLATTQPAPSQRRSLLLIGNPTPRAPEFPALGYAGPRCGHRETFRDRAR